MDKYVIGRVERPWKGFLPPIQGGRFRSMEEIERDNLVDVDALTEQDSSSQASSDPPSPIFDPADRSATLRKRRVDESLSRSSSSTSISLLEFEPDVVKKESLTERKTREDIEYDLNKYPSLGAATQTEIIDKYRLLHDRLRKEGLFNCNYTAYAIELARYTFLFGMCLWTLHLGWYSVSGLFLGLFWHQVVFTAHDAGHMGITHNYQADTIIGIIIADFVGGLSMGWWKRSHNVHHIATNLPEHDPDSQLMPFFAISHRFFESLRSTYYDCLMPYDPFAKFVIRYQHYLYYPILAFGRFNLYVLSWHYLLLGLGPRKGPAWWHRWFEIAGQVFFWTWFGYGILYCSIPTWSGRVAFVLISHIVTMPLHVQITLSHFAMSTSDLGVRESFPQRMLRTTMDVDCPQWLDFFHGGLQFQAIHHLFPRMPRHNLRRAQKLVQEFCEDVGVPYAMYGFLDGNKQVIGRLGDVAKQARILAACQQTMAESGDFGHHH